MSNNECEASNDKVNEIGRLKKRKGIRMIFERYLSMVNRKLYQRIFYVMYNHYQNLFVSTFSLTVLFSSTLLYSILLFSTPIYSTLFYSTPFYSTLFHSIPFFSELKRWDLYTTLPSLKGIDIFTIITSPGLHLFFHLNFFLGSEIFG